MRRLSPSGPGGIALALLAVACGPVGPIPGTHLSGEVASAAVEDWSFTRDHLEIEVETRGRWLPHAVTTICMAVGPRLYVPSRNASEKSWVQNVLRDPDVRVRIADRIYERTAVRVTDRAELAPVALDFMRKYYGVEADGASFLTEPPAPGDDRADLWIFRLDPRGSAP
jgi:hypothetical protein